MEYKKMAVSRFEFMTADELHNLTADESQEFSRWLQTQSETVQSYMHRSLCGNDQTVQESKRQTYTEVDIDAFIKESARLAQAEQKKADDELNSVLKLSQQEA